MNSDKRQIAFLFILFPIIISAAIAQNIPALYDAENQRIGTIIDVGFGGSLNSVVVATRDGTLMRLTTALETGDTALLRISDLIFLTDDCSGQAHAWTETRGVVFYHPSEESYFIGDVESPIIGILGEPPTQSFTKLTSEGNCVQGSPPTQPPRGIIPVNEIDSAAYGFTAPGGFKNPVRIRMESSEVTFCNGFEACR